MKTSNTPSKSSINIRIWLAVIAGCVNIAIAGLTNLQQISEFWDWISAHNSAATPPRTTDNLPEASPAPLQNQGLESCSLTAPPLEVGCLWATLPPTGSITTGRPANFG